MPREVLEYLRPVNGIIVDACLGGGGHARSIIEALVASDEGRRNRDSPAGRERPPAHDGGGQGRGRRSFGLLGIDRDPEAVASAQRQLGDFDYVEIVHANYTDLPALVRELGFAPVTGVLFDFGASLHQLLSGPRGFAIDADGPIDMRFDQTADVPSARDLIRRSSERTLRDWFRTYGEEPMSGRVARVIYERRREMETTGDLVRAVRDAVPARFARKALARVFQALRIVTNHEIENIRRGLAGALEVLVPTGRLVALSYHSLEDKEVKQLLRAGRTVGKLRVLTPKPILPGAVEVARNFRARSARLRAAEVIS
ncbi:16S rRNA (cytosine(1402)-N(4))-methyltransferase RsmH [candidate division WOR-3 bacterium]|nr:16S rRNA (cytosine(1402)-N(4))-methyltransferase RsmH [candidate division WOR-3 bacterium]